MILSRRRDKDRLDRRRSLAGTPLLHDGVKLEEGLDGTIALKMKIERGSGFLERFRPPVTDRKYQLDEFGTFVVQQIRKRKNVLDIIKAFEHRFQMSHRESELGVVAFIKMLMQRNILSVIVERPEK